MLGLLFGTACLIGLIKTARHGRCGHGGGCGGGGYGGGGGGCGRGYGRWGGGHGCGDHGGGHGGWGGWGGHDGHQGHQGHQGGGQDSHQGGGWGGHGMRWMLRGLFERLETTPGQEKVILEAVETLKAQRTAMRSVFQATRSDAAKGFRAEGFDEALMGAAFAHQDEAITAVRKAAMDAFAKVHAALDEKQRRELADMIDRGFAGWQGGGHHRHGGPYRF